MSISDKLKIQYSAPLSGFNCRNNWDRYQSRFKDPWGYLDSYGVDVVVEMLYSGLGPRQIAQQFNINQRILMAWIHADEERKAAYEEAFQCLGDDQMFEARDILDNCGLSSEQINKAGKQAEHRRHMAKGFGSRRWGTKVDLNQNVTATLSYQFNIGLSPEQQARVIDGSCKKMESTQPEMINVNDLIGPGMQSVPLDIGDDKGMTYEEARASETGE